MVVFPCSIFQCKYLFVQVDCGFVFDTVSLPQTPDFRFCYLPCFVCPGAVCGITSLRCFIYVFILIPVFRGKRMKEYVSFPTLKKSGQLKCLIMFWYKHLQRESFFIFLKVHLAQPLTSLYKTVSQQFSSIGVSCQQTMKCFSHLGYMQPGNSLQVQPWAAASPAAGGMNERTLGFYQPHCFISQQGGRWSFICNQA